MGLAQLQRAALAPDRWTRLIDHNSVSSNDLRLSSEGIQPVSSIDTSLRSHPDHTSRLFLVPGGRILFSIDSSGQYIDLWDIGVPGGEPTTPVRVSTVDTWPTKSVMFGYTVCEAGGGRLRIGVRIAIDGHGKQYVATYSWVS